MKKNIQIAASILSSNLLDLKEQIREMEKCGISVLHIDVMDGHFVPNLTFGPIIVRELRRVTNMTLDCHLMLTNPDQYIVDFAEAGADIITVHQEAAIHLHRSIQLIKSTGKKVGIALNPATSEHSIDYLYKDLDLILLMSVNPGFGGQKFIPQVTEKIKLILSKIKKYKPSIILEVDGGVRAENAKKLIDLGVDWLVVGSGIFAAASIEKGVNSIKNAIRS